MNEEMPIVSIQFQSMKHRIQHLLDERYLNLREQINKALDVACSEENLQIEIQRQVEAVLPGIIKDAVNSALNKRALRQAVWERVDALFPYEEHEKQNCFNCNLSEGCRLMKAGRRTGCLDYVEAL